MAEHLVSIPDLGVLHLDRPTIVGPQALVLSRERILISSTSFWDGRVRAIPDWARHADVERVKGTVISLGTDYAFGNYGHFLLDCVPRVALIEEAGVSWDDADHIYCTVPSTDAGRLLDRLGVPTDRRILAQPGSAIRPDRGIIASYPGSRRNYPAWSVAFLRDRLGVPAGPQSRRLYIPRRAHRRIHNVEELMPILEEHGFEVFEPGVGTEDPRHAFAEAEAVVGGHGAGLADLVFCREGAAVLELLPDSHQKPYYMTAAGSAGLRYGYLVGRGVDDGRERRHWDQVIDPTEFRAALEDMLG